MVPGLCECLVIPVLFASVVSLGTCLNDGQASASQFTSEENNEA